MGCYRMDSVQSFGKGEVIAGWYGVDPTTTNLKPNPHALYRHLRDVQPVNLTPMGDWRLSRYTDIQKLLKHSRSGMRDMNGLIPGETRAESEASKFMLRMDPPDHDRLRNLVSKAFTPRALNSMRPAVEALVSSELDRVTPLGAMDLVADLALAVPAASMCAMLGVPFEDRHRLTKLVSLVTYRLAKQSYPHLQEQSEAAIMELAVYMMELIEARRAQPSDDILGHLVMAEEAGDRLSTDELLQQCIGLLVAGLETTIGLIANGMVCFARYPGEFERLAANPALVSTAVEEVLRFEPSVPLTLRVLWEDTEFSGITIPANATVVAVLIGANRDPQMFTDPDRFDIGRNEAKHCSFGGGIHFCLGSHLAKMNAEIAFSQMARRFTAIEVDEEKIEWAPSLFRIPGSIPARFQRRI
jgi:pimeloyl-[acyl-carrier protein] synthase